MSASVDMLECEEYNSPDNLNLDDTMTLSRLTPNASFSRLAYYVNCPRAFKYKYIDKLVEPARPPLVGKNGKELVHGHVRGSEVHQMMEDFIKDPDANATTVPEELINIRAELAELKELQSSTSNPDDFIFSERKWYCDANWKEVSEESIEKLGYFLLVIIDCMVIIPSEGGFVARVIDLKTGKRYGNEMKHQRQLALYALAAFHRFPKLTTIVTEIWYSDLGLIHKKEYSRAQIMAQQRYWDTQIEDMRVDVEFEPKANKSACKFCSWGDKKHSNKWVNKSGDCSHSVE